MAISEPRRLVIKSDWCGQRLGKLRRGSWRRLLCNGLSARGERERQARVHGLHPMLLHQASSFKRLAKLRLAPLSRHCEPSSWPALLSSCYGCRNNGIRCDWARHTNLVRRLLGWLAGCTNGWMDGWKVGWMNRRLHSCLLASRQASSCYACHLRHPEQRQAKTGWSERNGRLEKQTII